MNDFSQALTVLSAMISPVVLIIATGSLVMTTSQRLSRVIERTRRLTEQLKQLVKEAIPGVSLEEESKILFTLLNLATKRARLLQKSMTALYLAISVFLATSLMIAVVDITDSEYIWLPIVLGMVGAALLFYASLVLIKESRIAINAVDYEMKQTIQLFQNHFPNLTQEQKRGWWDYLLHKPVMKP